MKNVFRLILIALVVCLSQSSFQNSMAGEGEFSWVDSFLEHSKTLCDGSLMRTVPRMSRKQQQFLRLSEPLIRAFKRYLSEGMQRAENVEIPVRPRTKDIPFKGQRYPILAILGAGSSAIVYVVNRDGVPTVLKEFYDEDNADWEVKEFQSGRHGPTFIDRDKRKVLLTFVLGLPLPIVLSTEEMQSLGMTYDQADALEAFVRSSKGSKTDILDEDDNFVLDLLSGRIVSIDPV